MNNVTLIGRLTKDIEVRYTEAELAVGKFTLAVDRQKFGNKDEANTADFINIVVFGKQAENIEKFTEKGKLIAISGHIQTGSYVNKDGVKVYTTSVVAEKIKFLEWKNADEDVKVKEEEIPF